MFEYKLLRQNYNLKKLNNKNVMSPTSPDIKPY